MPEVMSCNR